MLEIFGTIAMVLAVAGVVANNRKRSCCFYIWIISNLISAVLHYQLGSVSLLVRDCVFIVLAIEGILKWRKDDDG